MVTKLGIIGYGVVGEAITYGFKDCDIKYYDKYKNSDDLATVCKHSEFIFISLPTPYKNNRIDLSIIEDSVKEITKYTNGTNKIVVIKSTVVPGTTKRLAAQYPKTNFAFNPEFLTEANYLEDFVNADRHVIGAEDAKVRLRLSAIYTQRWPKTTLFQTDPTTAELVKYAANSFLSMKVIFANEYDELCKKLGVEWSEAKEMVVADKRIGPTHLDIHSLKGFGGKCLIPSTVVQAEKGLKYIKDLCVGEKIFDGESFTEVTAMANRNVAETIKLSMRGREITGSPDHVHLVFNKDDALEEVLLKNVTTSDWGFIPRPKFNNYVKTILLGSKPNNYYKHWLERVRLDEDWGRLIGLYLSEGCTSLCSKKKNLYGVYWSFGEHEEVFANEIVSLLEKKGFHGYKKLQVSNGTYGISRCWVASCRQQNLVKIFEKLNLGIGAWTKNIPMLEPKVAKAAIGGWLDGGGSYYDGTLMGFSRSKDLIKSIDTILLSLGYCACVGKDGQTIVISTRSDVEKICKWTKRFTFNKQRYVRKISYASPTMKLLENGWKVKISKTERLSPATVVSMETSSGRYIANNILTHNCFPKDMIAILGSFEEHEVDANLLKTAWKKNLDIREVYDWEEIPFVKTD